MVFGGEAALQVVFVVERPMAVVDAEEIAEAIVGVINRAAVGQGFSYQATGAVPLITSNQTTAIVAVLGLFQQMPGEIINIGSAAAIKAGLLPYQAVGVVLKPIGFPDLVFNLGE